MFGVQVDYEEKRKLVRILTRQFDKELEAKWIEAMALGICLAVERSKDLDKLTTEYLKTAEALRTLQSYFRHRWPTDCSRELRVLKKNIRNDTEVFFFGTTPKKTKEQLLLTMATAEIYVRVKTMHKQLRKWKSPEDRYELVGRILNAAFPAMRSQSPDAVKKTLQRTEGSRLVRSLYALEWLTKKPISRDRKLTLEEIIERTLAKLDSEGT